MPNNMISARKLFLVAVGFCILLSLHYLSLTSDILPPDPSGGPGSPPIIKPKPELTSSEEYQWWKDKAQVEKGILEARIREDYRKSKPLAKRFITHDFDENGNITKPVAKPYLLIHVAKTAGSTLSAVFKRSEKPSKFTHTWAHPKLQDMPKIAQKDMVFGHFRYGLHYYFNRTCNYMTVLRSPIDRVVSHYYYHLQHKKDPGHLFAKNRTFEEWIRDSPAGNNEQTRVISGMRSEFNLSQETLDMAKYHLRTFAVVGLTEEYHKTLMLLKYIGGLSIARYRAINKGVKRPKLADVPPATVELIKQRNWADIQLYELAKEIFDTQLEHMPESFTTDLEKFEALMSKSNKKTTRKKRPTIAALPQNAT